MPTSRTTKAAAPAKAAPPPKKRGRPKGTGTGPTVQKISVTLPIGQVAWLKSQSNASAEVSEALSAHIARRSRRR